MSETDTRVASIWSVILSVVVVATLVFKASPYIIVPVLAMLTGTVKEAVSGWDI